MGVGSDRLLARRGRGQVVKGVEREVTDSELQTKGLEFRTKHRFIEYQPNTEFHP